MVRYLFNFTILLQIQKMEMNLLTKQNFSTPQKNFFCIIENLAISVLILSYFMNYLVQGIICILLSSYLAGYLLTYLAPLEKIVIMHNLNCKIKTCEQIEKYNVCIQNHMIITSPELKVKILR